MERIPEKITEYYAWVCIESDGGEGVPAYQFQSGNWLPFVGADMDRMNDLRPYAIQIALARKTGLKLLKFGAITVLEEVDLEGVGR